MKRILLTLVLIFTGASVFALPALVERQLFKVYDTDSIQLDLTWENIDIQECDEDDNILVEVFCNKKKFAPTIKSSGSTIIVKSVNSKNYFFIGEQRKCTVIVRIPSTAKFEKFSMGTTSGNIHTQMVITTEKLSSSSTSGNQSLTVEAYAQDAIIGSTSGDIYVEAIYGERLKTSSTSGSINISGFDGNTCSVEATSGSLKLSKLKVNQTRLNTTSGSITFEGTIYSAFDASSTSGMINLELTDAPANNSRAHATSGSIFIGLPGDSSFSLRAETTSGTFINALTKEKISDHVNYNRDINNGGASIILSTTSGRITVDSTDGVIANVIDSAIEPDIPVVSFDDPIF